MDNIKPWIESYQNHHEKDFSKKVSQKDAYDSLFGLVGYIKVLKRIEKRIELEKKINKKFKKGLESDNIGMTTTNNK